MWGTFAFTCFIYCYGACGLVDYLIRGVGRWSVGRGDVVRIFLATPVKSHAVSVLSDALAIGEFIAAFGYALTPQLLDVIVTRSTWFP